MNFRKTDTIWRSIEFLDSWVTKRDWIGIDKYQKALYISNSKCKRISSRLATYAQSEMTMRWIGIKPLINYKALGVFLQAYCVLYNTTKNEQYLDKAKKCADVLILGNNCNTGKGDWGWGHPFENQSRILFPAYTPYAIIATQVGFGLLSLYRITNQEKYFQACKEICEHFLSDYYIDRTVCDNGICFSYSPIDKFHIHNANLSIGQFLSDVGVASNNKHYIKTAMQCANYALNEMDEHGSLNYWGKDQANGDQQDIYHCGYEARHLLRIGINCGYERAIQGALLRYNFMIHSFIDNGIPWRDKRKRLVDLHGCAEAIITSSEMNGYCEQAREIANVCTTWALKNARADDGHFYNTVTYKGKEMFYDKSPYMRWIQSWMLLALAEAYCVNMQQETS